MINRIFNKLLLSLFKNAIKDVCSTLLEIHNSHHVRVSINSFTDNLEKRIIHIFATQTAGG
jgi:hypothetical protein